MFEGIPDRWADRRFLWHRFLGNGGDRAALRRVQLGARKRVVIGSLADSSITKVGSHQRTASEGLVRRRGLLGCGRDTGGSRG
jgi:hypothetical protein